jgi:hypothetical protein
MEVWNMTTTAIDEIEVTRTVLFVGDYFALTTTVILDEKLRYEDEDDDEFAIRIASVLMEEYYGWDVGEKSNDIGVMDEDDDE